MLYPEELQPQINKIRNLRAEWVKWLDSGELEQTTSQLAEYDYASYCCLGVAEEKVGYVCDITRGAGGGYTMPDPDTYRNYEDTLYEDSELHSALREALGLSESQQDILISLNDEGASFGMIANVIRRLPVYVNGSYYDV
jgi:hypothetical protein